MTFAAANNLRGDAMLHLHAQSALLPQGWATNVRLTSQAGAITKVEANAAPCPGDERHAILIPAMPNVHSHAFQRAMAGMAEKRSAQADNFWSWRDVMYRFALAVDPDDVETIAALAYMEMLEAGFGRVGEFHYMHHDRSGAPYSNIAEMAVRIVAAAAQTGIGLTLLPVFYAHANFGGAAPAPAQRRFVSSPDIYVRLLEGCEAAVQHLPGGNVGIAPHSLRAVTPAQLDMLAKLRPSSPLHLHIAEQMLEVEDCIAWSGARPVQWLLNHQNVTPRWCLVHATHMNGSETQALAQSGAVAGLCPVTEANLGDGTFSADEFLRLGGRFGVGSDSNVLIGVADELRQLEYSQRLLHRARNVLSPLGGSTGRRLFEAGLLGGSLALGVPTGTIAPGAPADFVTLQAGSAALAGMTGDDVLDGWIFVGGSRAVECVWINGQKLVCDGKHVQREAILHRFAAVMTKLRAG